MFFSLKRIIILLLLFSSVSIWVERRTSCSGHFMDINSHYFANIDLCCPGLRAQSKANCGLAYPCCWYELQKHTTKRVGGNGKVWARSQNRLGHLKILEKLIQQFKNDVEAQDKAFFDHNWNPPFIVIKEMPIERSILFYFNAEL